MSSPGIATQRKSLGEVLVEAEVITVEQLRQAYIIHQRDGSKIEHILIEQGFITAQQLAIFSSLHLNIPFVNLKKQVIEPKALELIPESVARRYGVVPLDITDDALILAMEDPVNIQIVEELSSLTRKRIEPVIAIRQDVQEAIDVNYRVGGEIEKQLSQLPTKVSAEGANITEARISADAIAQAPIVRTIDLLLKQAVRDRASDVHIEPSEDCVRVRYRIDGILHTSLTLPLSVHPALISRLKIMAGMNIAERRRPQDGQITLKVSEDKEVDIRVASSNTIYGEMMVLRLLDKTFALLTLPEIGFLPESLKQYQEILRTPFGMVLISGPTGSGKTTTLYASINQVDSVGRNIITVEDPVEYRFSNINQMPVNSQAGVTFATGLRAIMRLDPDVILVGEIRDSETAQIAVQAALTGHLVLSSVHANDTTGVIVRLIDLGVEPFLVASALVGVVAQRMVRRICPYCSRGIKAIAEEKLAYEEEMGEESPEFLYGGGCNSCANTGYAGRTAILEVMTVSDTIRRMILNNTGTDEIRNQAFNEGMISLWRDGMLKVRDGITTPFEVLRNVYSIG